MTALAKKFDIREAENRLGILSPDRKWLNVEKFFEHSPFPSQKEAKQAGVNVDDSRNEQVELDSLKDLRKGIEQVVIATDLTVELFQGDVEKAVGWFITPNDFTAGDSPFDVCLRGDGDFLINWLGGRLGKDWATEF